MNIHSSTYFLKAIWSSLYSIYNLYIYISLIMFTIYYKSIIVECYYCDTKRGNNLPDKRLFMHTFLRFKSKGNKLYNKDSLSIIIVVAFGLVKSSFILSNTLILFKSSQITPNIVSVNTTSVHSIKVGVVNNA